MSSQNTKVHLKKELKSLFKSMDFISLNFLNKEDIDNVTLKMYFNIYQQLGLAWEYLGLQCGHWDGYKKNQDGSLSCKICGKIKDAKENFLLLPLNGKKIIGKKLLPNSKMTFNNKQEAILINDTILFHGAYLNVDVHNSYESSLSKEKITLAAERIITLKESNIECHIDQHLISIRINKKRKKTGKNKYGAFPGELTKKELKNFPVIFNFDEYNRFLGLEILR